jgi:hypothetical protein
MHAPLHHPQTHTHKGDSHTDINQDAWEAKCGKQNLSLRLVCDARSRDENF